MVTPSLRRIWMVLWTLLVVGGGACTQPFEGDDEVSGAMAVELVIHGHEVEATSLTPVGGMWVSGPTRGPALRWEFVDEDGVLQASGEVEDPRRLRSEHDLTAAAHDVKAAAGRLRVVVPAESGRIVIYEPADGGWDELGEVPVVAPDLGDGSSQGQNLIQAWRDLVGPPVEIHASSSPHALRLLIVGEGYRQTDLADFRQHAAELTAELLAIEGFADHADSVAVFRQDVLSDEQGLADPRTGFDPVTAFELSYGDDVTRPRRCMMYTPSVGAAAMAALRERTLAVQADAVVILANTEDYGGCASPGDKVVTTSRHPQSARILAHELGHTVFGLSDEYEYGACGAYEDGPNVAAHLHDLPWEDLLTTTYLPTPPTVAGDHVGAFEGANHCPSGRYRPTHACRMRGLDDTFCPVCLREIDRFFDLRARNLRGRMTVENRTGVGLFVRCPDQPSAVCSDWQYLQPGETATLRTTGDGYAFIVDASLADGSSIRWRRLVPERDHAVVYANAAQPLTPTPTP